MNKTIANSQVWFLNSGEIYFLIPENASIPEGNEMLIDLAGNQCLLDVSAVNEFSATADEVLEFLKQDYTNQLAKTKQSLMNLNLFAAKTGKNDATFLTNMMKDEWNDTQKGTPFAEGKDIVEGLLGHIRETGKTHQEQQSDFTQLFSRIPEITKFFDEKTLAEAAKNPEKWASEMDEKFFGKENAAKRKARAEKLKREVQESIARGLRNAGIEPIPPSTKDNK